MRYIPLLAILFFFSERSKADSTPVDNRPNIILIVTDDQRNDSLGFAGHPILETPEIDKLAKQGTRFQNAFVTSPICAASRASILTGLYEREHGFTFGKPPVTQEHCQNSYPAILRSAGYQTAFFGKFGINVPSGTEEIWFDKFEKVFRKPYLKPQPDGTLKHTTNIIADRAIEFLESTKKEKPFCLSISFNAPHAEDSDLENHYPPPVSVADLYSEQSMPSPRLSELSIFENLPDFLKYSMNRERFHWRWDTAEKYQKNLRNYFRMISGIDREIGRIRETLDRLDLAQNTVIIFTSDNGCYMGDRGLAGKWSHYDQSLHVPLIIYDPRSAESQNREEFALNIDLAPTILDLARVLIPNTYQGRSLIPLLSSSKDISGWRDYFFCEHLMHHPKIPKWEGIVSKRYKYVDYFEQESNRLFLYDILNDPDELHNLAKAPEHQETLQTLQKLIIRRMNANP